MTAQNDSAAYTVEIVDFELARLAATVETAVTPAEVPERITGFFDILYRWLADAPVKQVGHNHAIYYLRDGNLSMQAAVPVSGPFQPTPDIEFLEFEGGRSAHTRHIGPYAELGSAYHAVFDWTRNNGIDTRGVNWEVYGDWSDDPSKLVTDVYVGLPDA